MRGHAAATVVTSVQAATSDTPLLAGSTTDSRKGASVYYDAAAILYLLAGPGAASATNYTCKLGTGFLTYWEAPSNYTGPVRGFWSAATGAALVTDYA